MESEKAKAKAGKLYDANNDIELVSEREACKEVCYELNSLRPSQKKERESIIRRLFGKTGKSFLIEQPFYCDYGYNIEIGENFYSNVNCVILDGAKVTFGDNVFVGANTIILPDVKIGSNIVIGAGSIVNKDILDSGVYVGTPVKYICTIDKLKDKRKENPLLEYNKGSLANESVDNLWKTFLQKRKQ